jgi:hypothetical protein
VNRSHSQSYGNTALRSNIQTSPYTNSTTAAYPFETGTSQYESQPQQPSSKRLYKKIGDVCCYEDNTKDYHFRCHIEGCSKVSCGRYQELERHHHAFHRGPDTWIWCPVKGCERSKAVGKRGFPGVRKDKLREHTLNAHSFELES